MFRIVETFNNAVVAASAVQYHAGSEILHALMVAAVDANLLTAHDVSGECPGDQIHPMSRNGIVFRLRMNILRNMIGRCNILHERAARSHIHHLTASADA